MLKTLQCLSIHNISILSVLPFTWKCCLAIVVKSSALGFVCFAHTHSPSIHETMEWDMSSCLEYVETPFHINIHTEGIKWIWCERGGLVGSLVDLLTGWFVRCLVGWTHIWEETDWQGIHHKSCWSPAHYCTKLTRFCPFLQISSRRKEVISTSTINYNSRSKRIIS